LRPIEDVVPFARCGEVQLAYAIEKHLTLG
jgi:hypothetical protein